MAFAGELLTCTIAAVASAVNPTKASMRRTGLVRLVVRASVVPVLRGVDMGDTFAAAPNPVKLMYGTGRSGSGTEIRDREEPPTLRPGASPGRPRPRPGPWSASWVAAR